MAWTKVKTAAVLGVAVVFLTGSTFLATEWVQTAQSATPPELQGAWEGAWDLGGQNVVDGGRILARIVVHVAKSNAAYAATGDNLAWSRKGFRFRKVDYQYPSVRIAVSDWEYFDGQVNRRGTEIAGQYTIVGNTVIPMTLKRTARPPAAPERLRESDYAPRNGSDLQGYWTGKLGALPLSWKIAEATNGTFRAEMDNLEQGAPHQTVDVEYDPPVVRLVLTTQSGLFEGEYYQDTREIVGQWIQGGRTPMTLRRVDGPEVAPAERDFVPNTPDDLAGHWKTMADLGSWVPLIGKIEVTLHIARFPNGGFTASLRAVDYDALFLPTNLPADVPATSVTFSAPEVKLVWNQSLGYTFTGEVHDGQMAGTVRCGNISIPVVFERSTVK